MQKDLKSEAKKGRFFPLRFGDAVRLVKEYGLVDYSGKRIKIRMENTESDCKYGYPIADIVPEEDLALYSLPITLPEESCKELVKEAIDKLSNVQERIINTKSTEYSYYCAYLDHSNGLKIRITRKDISLQTEKYRGDSKFSNAFNQKNKQVQEIEL